MRINIAEIGLQRAFYLYATEISTRNRGTNRENPLFYDNGIAPLET